MVVSTATEAARPQKQAECRPHLLHLARTNVRTRMAGPQRPRPTSRIQTIPRAENHARTRTAATGFSLAGVQLRRVRAAATTRAGSSPTPLRTRTRIETSTMSRGKRTRRAFSAELTSEVLEVASRSKKRRRRRQAKSTRSRPVDSSLNLTNICISAQMTEVKK